MTVTDDLKNYLIQQGPINCTVGYLAQKIGANEGTVHQALYWIRRNARWTNWTIPYQPSGPYDVRAWRVVDGSKVSVREWREAIALTARTMNVLEQMASNRRVLLALLEQAAPSAKRSSMAQAALIQLDASIASMQMAIRQL